MKSRKFLLLLSTAGWWFSGTPASAQSTVAIPGAITVPDVNGVDALSGTFTTASPFSFNAPAAGHLDIRMVLNGMKLSFPLNIYMDDDTPPPDSGEPSFFLFTVQAGGDGKVFSCGRAQTSGLCTQIAPGSDGSFLRATGQQKYLFVDRYGTKVEFDRPLAEVGGPGCRDNPNPCYYTKYYFSASRVTYPSGERLYFEPKNKTVVENSKTYLVSTVTSNLGYSLRFYDDRTGTSFQDPSTVPDGRNWSYTARGGNAAKMSAALFKGDTRIGTIRSSLTTSGNPTNYSWFKQTDDLNRSYSVESEIKPVVWCSGDLNSTCTIPVDATQMMPVKVTTPGGIITSLTNSTTTTNGIKHVTKVTTGTRTWTYDYQRSVHTITNPDSQKQTFNISQGDMPYGYSSVYPDQITTHRRLTSLKNELEKTTTLTYSEANREHLVSTRSEADRYSYDINFANGNITKVLQYGKSGAVLNPDGIWRASYPQTCGNDNITCAKPLTVTDANNNVKTYTYNQVHGGIATETFPLDAQGRKKRLIYTYEEKATTSGSLFRLSEVLTCFVGTNDACTGSTSRTSFTYWGSTLLPLTVSASADGVPAASVTTYAYDDAGRIKSVTDPNGGTSYRRYDAVGRLTGEVFATLGAALRQAKRYNYDNDDRLIGEETGTVLAGTDISDTVWNSFSRTGRTAHAYDLADGSKLETRVEDGAGVASAVTQFKYDAVGRLQCTARRMNSAEWGSRTDACAAQTVGSYGRDRITRVYYDFAGREVQIRKGYGGSLEQAYVTYDYTSNGNRQNVVDANGNRALFSYDDFDRLKEWRFPSTAKPTAFNNANQTTAIQTSTTPNSADYEAYTYYNDGTRKTLRKRDGRVISFFIDALNRVVQKTVPDGCAPIQSGLCPSSADTRDVFYEYDLQGLQVKARYDSLNGDGVTNEYDGLGRLTSSSTKMSGTDRSVSSKYDAKGNRYEVTTPGGIWTYAYDKMDRLSGLYEGSGQSVVKASWTYNNLGLKDSATEIGGSGSTWGYNAVGQLTSLSDTFKGGGGNVTFSMKYNGAGQVRELGVSNLSYSPNSMYNVVRSYTNNGLNQYSVVGYNAADYDSNGNLRCLRPTGSTDCTETYGYDAENRLVRGPNGSELMYDPLGRLFQIKRPSKVVQFLYDGDQIVADFEGASLANSYVHGPSQDDPLLWYPTGSPMRWYHRNHQGSITGVADASGQLVAMNAYDVFGVPNTANQGRFQYTGQAWLREIGLYYYKARMYSPLIGRFLQVDPIGYDDQINLYAYVGNDPINGRDPTGTQLSRIPEDLRDLWKDFKKDPVGTVVDVLTSIEPNPTTVLAGGIGAARIAGTEAKVAAEAGETAAKAGAEARSAIPIGSHAGESIAARSTARDFTKAERSEVNRIGAETGCHTCGSTAAGTKSGNFVPDHQPPSALNQSGSPQRLYPQCIGCSRQQGLEIARKRLQEQ